MSKCRSSGQAVSSSSSAKILGRTRVSVTSSGGQAKLLGCVVYGDQLTTPQATNHRTRVYQIYDGAGVATSTAFDFKGHAVSEQRQLTASKTTEPDWSPLLGQATIAQMATAAALLLDPETFSASSEHDALGRVLKAISPDSSEVLYSYDEAGNLQRVDLKHRGSNTVTPTVGDITYNARGQRMAVIHGAVNSPTTTTSYTYDPQTYRLTRLHTVRHNDNTDLQDLSYHYDPAGNITDIRDDAQQTVYFQNAVVEPANSYTYDAVYRLIEATGREHSTQGTTQRTHEQAPIGPQPMASDPSAMRRYTQKHTYDAVGNILKVQHIPAAGTGWTRRYQYAANGNQLQATSAPGDAANGPYSHSYTYDEHGSMTSMPHIASMVWNHGDELQETIVGTQTVYFQYAGGMRSRKYVETADSTTTEERIYLGPFELYRKRIGVSLTLERETLHISDGSGRICMVETKTVDDDAVQDPPGIWRYQHGNHLGSAAVEIDGAGAIISYEEYHPYGTSAYRAVDSNIDVSAKRYRYTGMERDEEASLEYHSARYYAPWLGRWTASDPLGLEGSSSRYDYAHLRPVALSDPNGLAPPVEGEVYGTGGLFLLNERGQGGAGPVRYEDEPAFNQGEILGPAHGTMEERRQRAGKRFNKKVPNETLEQALDGELPSGVYSFPVDDDRETHLSVREHSGGRVEVVGWTDRPVEEAPQDGPARINAEVTQERNEYVLGRAQEGVDPEVAGWMYYQQGVEELVQVTAAWTILLLQAGVDMGGGGMSSKSSTGSGGNGGRAGGGGRPPPGGRPPNSANSGTPGGSGRAPLPPPAKQRLKLVQQKKSAIEGTIRRLEKTVDILGRRPNNRTAQGFIKKITDKNLPEAQRSLIATELELVEIEREIAGRF